MQKLELVTKKERKVSMRRFFNCKDSEDEYQESVIARIDALEEQWKESYKPALHDVLVMELVRSEMMAFEYEKLLANHKETEMTPMLLRQERIQIGILRDKLLISLSAVKKEEPPGMDSSTPSMFDLVEQAHEEKLEPENPDDEEDI